MSREADDETSTSLINRAGVTESLELTPSTESAWIEVIHKMLAQNRNRGKLWILQQGPDCVACFGKGFAD